MFEPYRDPMQIFAPRQRQRHGGNNGKPSVKGAPAADFGSILFIALYLLVYFYFRSALPEKWTVDSGRIMQLLQSDSVNDVEGSFAATAAFFQLLGQGNLDLFTAAVGASVLWVGTRRVDSMGEFVLRWLLLGPCMLLNMLAPSKDTLVLLVTLGVLLFSRVLDRKILAWIVVTLVLYGVYGMLVRKYYLLIAGLWLPVYFLFRSRRSFTLVAIAIGIAALFIVPREILEFLQSSRDNSNAYAAILGSDNRTAFNNPLPPNSPENFIGNYLYAVGVLSFPFLAFFGASDLIAQVFIFAVYARLARVYRRARRKTFGKPSVLLAALVVSHLLVQFIFEPDVGSFLRHLSSVVLYIIYIGKGDQVPRPALTPRPTAA